MRYKVFRQLHDVNAQNVIPSLRNAGALDSSLLSEADKISYCGEYINTVQCEDCGTNHFKSFSRCKSKFCRLCQHAKSGLWTYHLLRWIKQWLDMGNYVVFLNLTIKDTESLEDGLNQLEGAWRLMTNKYRKGFLSLFPGGFKSIEVKTGKNSKLWHPHIHALVLKDRYSKDTDFLHYIWPKCVYEMGGEAVNLKILPFKKQPSESSEDYDLRLVQSIKEVCKYITKFDWDKEEPERIIEMYHALKGKRQYAVWGALQHVRKAVAKDLDGKTNGEIRDFVCQKCGCTVGRPNKLFRAIWDGLDEPVIEDYKFSVPETTVTEREKQRLRIVNKFNSTKTSAETWMQDALPLDSNRHEPFE